MGNLYTKQKAKEKRKQNQENERKISSHIMRLFPLPNVRKTSYKLQKEKKWIECINKSFIFETQMCLLLFLSLVSPLSFFVLMLLHWTTET